MRGRHFLVLLSLPFIVLPYPVDAQMRCGTELVHKGDSSVQVLEACGEPVSGRPNYFGNGDWVYNFGPGEFMVKVTIADGSVVRFEELGRGFVIDSQEETGPEPDR